MNHIRRAAIALASAAISLIGLVVVTPAAFATELAPPDGSAGVAASAGSSAGMAGWQIALIAVAAAVLASVLTAAVQRIRFSQTSRAAVA